MPILTRQHKKCVWPMDLVSQRKQSTLFKILVVVARLFSLCASSSIELCACLFAQEINVYATFVLEEINCTNTERLH